MNLNKRMLDRKLKISLYVGITLIYYQSKTVKLIFLINHAWSHEKKQKIIITWFFNFVEWCCDIIYLHIILFMHRSKVKIPLARRFFSQLHILSLLYFLISLWTFTIFLIVATYQLKYTNYIMVFVASLFYCVLRHE